MSNKQVKLNQGLKNGILYHYTKCNGINGIMNSNCFWATKSDFLNDPREFCYIENILKEVCRECIHNDTYRKLFLEDILEEQVLLSGGRNRDYFVLSFSRCRDSITMWSEFGHKTGYNIGFDGPAILERIQEMNAVDYYGFVIYDFEEQKQIVKRIICESVPESLNVSFADIVDAGIRDRKNDIYQKACRRIQKITAVYAMFFKNTAFREEQEYRLVFKKRKETQVLYREKDGFLIPYIQIQLSEKRLPVKEIMVAPQNHIDLAQKGMEYMMAEKGYSVTVELSNIKLRY